MDTNASEPMCSLQAPLSLELPALCRHLAPQVQVIPGPTQHHSFRFYDTFEWNLWLDEKALYHSGDHAVFAHLNQGWPDEVLLQQSQENAPAPFPAQWPQGPLRTKLLKRCGLRALQRVANLSVTTRRIDCLNAEDKVVFRFDLITLYESEKTTGPFYRLCRPKPLKGYTAEAKEVESLLRAAGCIDAGDGPLADYLIRQGRPPEPYSLRPVFGLDPEEPAREAVRDIVRRMLALARLQEPGIIQDIDTEFLHDYRICLRKIRSVISLMPGVYSEADTQRLKDQWAERAAITNLQRDLDVYLLDRDRYTGMLPPGLQLGLPPFFAGIQQERNLAQVAVAKHLRSKSYQKKMEVLESFFTEPDEQPATECSHAPIRACASKGIYHRYRKIRKASAAIGQTTPDKDIHQLRIECKKLRYLLEFFGELYPHDELHTLVNKLKHVQTCLGRFNDYALQQASLLAYCAEHSTALTTDQALSIGGLVAVLNQAQRKERARAEKALNRFSKATVNQQFRQTFKKLDPQRT